MWCTSYFRSLTAILFENPESVVLLEEVVVPRTDLPPLLLRLNERKPEPLDYLSKFNGAF